MTENNIYRIAYTNLDQTVQRPVAYAVFFCVILLAMINPPNSLVLVGLWGFISSIVCPLIVSVLPGCFYYFVMKEQEEESKAKKAYGIAFCVFGMIVMPVFLTLSAKNLFNGSSNA